MNILILFTKSTSLNYNKFLIIEAFKRHNNLINVLFYEIYDINNFLTNFDINKYKNYTFWMHQKIGSYLLTINDKVKLIKLNNIKTIFWMDDLHFPCTEENRYDLSLIYKDERYINCDLIISPSIDYFNNINCTLVDKTKFLFYFFDEKLIDKYNPKYDYFYRKNKILLSGKINDLSYSSRKIIYDNYSKNKDLYDYLQHPGYYNFKHQFIHQNYYDKLSEYKICILGLANYPVNFLLAKVIEILGTGSLGLFQKSNLYYKRLGLIKNKHYIEIDVINDKLILNNQEYKNFFYNINYMKIAQNGYDYIKNNFNSFNFIKKVLKIIK
jgi:hypothetical protein